MGNFKKSAFDEYLGAPQEIQDGIRSSLAVYDRDPKLAKKRNMRSAVLGLGATGITSGAGLGMLRSSYQNHDVKRGLKNALIGAGIGGAVGLGGGYLLGRHGNKQMERYHNDEDMMNLLKKQGYIRDDKEFSIKDRIRSSKDKLKSLGRKWKGMSSAKKGAIIGAAANTAGAIGGTLLAKKLGLIGKLSAKDKVKAAGSLVSGAGVAGGIGYLIGKRRDKARAARLAAEAGI